MDHGQLVIGPVLRLVLGSPMGSAMGSVIWSVNFSRHSADLIKCLELLRYMKYEVGERQSYSRGRLGLGQLAMGSLGSVNFRFKCFEVLKSI